MPRVPGSAVRIGGLFRWRILHGEDDYWRLGARAYLLAMMALYVKGGDLMKQRGAEGHASKD
jgi:hypothetical protein